MFEVSFSQASRKVEFFPWRRLNSFFLFVSALLRLVQWFVWASHRVRFMLSFVYLFVCPPMGKAEWGGNSVCWWLGLYFCFFCCLGEASCTGCYWWLGDARSCIQVVSFVWVLRGASLVAQRLKRLPAMWKTWAWSLGWEDTLEKGKATHSSILAWRCHGLYSPWAKSLIQLNDLHSLIYPYSALS